MNAEIATYPEPVRTEWKLLAKTRIENPSLSIAEIATALGRNANTVHMWIRRPEYQRYENWCIAQQNVMITPTMPLPTPRERKQLQDHINYFAEEMFERLQVIVEQTSDNKLLTDIAHDALDRAGFSAQKHVSRGAPTFVITEEAMRVLLSREQEAQGEVIVGEVVPRL